MARPLKQQNETTYSGRVGAIIRRRRLRKKLTVEQAADRAGMPTSTWYHAEAGRHLTLQRLPAIAEALGCKPRSLLPE